MVDRGGKVHTGWLDGQLSRAGLPPSLAFEFAQDTGRILGLGVHSKHKSSWQRSASLAEIRGKYDALLSRIEMLADDVRDATGSEQV